jgi:hypothetical protein
LLGPHRSDDEQRVFHPKDALGRWIRTFPWCYRREYCSDPSARPFSTRRGLPEQETKTNPTESNTKRDDASAAIETYQRDNRTTESRYTKGAGSGDPGPPTRSVMVVKSLGLNPLSTFDTIRTATDRRKAFPIPRSIIELAGTIWHLKI